MVRPVIYKNKVSAIFIYDAIVYSRIQLQVIENNQQNLRVQHPDKFHQLILLGLGQNCAELLCLQNRNVVTTPRRGVLKEK